MADLDGLARSTAVPSRARPGPVRIEMLGGFRVVLGGVAVDEGDWPGRRSRELVQVLALADGHRLARDQVIERLWPHLGVDAAAASLRKAAHHARRALADPEAVVLRGGRVSLLPSRSLETDVELFGQAAAAALDTGDAGACAHAAASYQGDLLPGALYEEWTQEPRRSLRSQLAELLRRGGQWERLVGLEPTEEPAYRELMREALDAGRRHAAIRWYERLELALARELGARPSGESEALYEECTAGIRAGQAELVGRRTELAEAMGALPAARDGGGSVILVRGPIGIGKSAFCHEVLARAQADGWRVASVAPAASGPPYGPIATIVEQLLACRPAGLGDLPPRSRAALAALTPAAGPGPPLDAGLTRHKVIAAVRRLLAAPDGASPPPATLVHVDDAQLCDDAAAEVLGQLASGSPSPFVVLLAFRPRPGGTGLPRALRELAGAGSAVTIDLGALSDGEVAALVSRTASEPPAPDVVEQLAQLAEGSPFLALELARAAAAGAPGSLPRTAREAITARFVDLEAPAVEFLRRLAVAGGDLDLESVLALGGRDEPETFALLDAALAAEALVVVRTRYRFGHELVRQTLMDDLAPHVRLSLHRDAAQRLAAAGAAPELVARHWLDGARPSEAVPWLLAATERAMALGAFTDALGHADRMLDHAPSHLDALRLRAEVLDALGDSRAPAAYAAAADAAGEPEAGELRARLALAQMRASDPAGALRTLERVAPTTTAGLLSQALALSAAAAIGRFADGELAAEKADEAYRLAVSLGDAGAILDATWAHALAAHTNGELPARLRSYLHDTHELPALAIRVFDGQLCVTERLLYGGLPNAEVIAFADGLAAEAERLGAVRGQAFALTVRGEAELLAGRLDDADRDFTAGARLHGRIGAVAGEALSLLGRARVAIYRGEQARAAPLLEEALLMARESDVGHHTLDRIFGTMVSAASDPAAGIRVVREAEAAIRGPAETCPTCRIAFSVPAAIAAAQAGDAGRASRYAHDAEIAVEVMALPPAWGASVAEVRGWLARAAGRRDPAREHFGLAAKAFEGYGQPLDAARCAELRSAG